VNEPLAPPLRCAECGREADEQARGWRALHGKEFPEDESEAFVFCPECYEREFTEGANLEPS
jgi:DNA-directed RNA polymerase subunit RPC12/RpoP